jgi:methionyl-tRNA formyltransferase
MADARVKTILCTSGGLFGGLVLGRLLAGERIQVVGIVLSTRVLRRRYGWLRGAVEQIRLSGIGYALYLWCATSLADLLGRLSPAGSLHSLAKRHGIPVLATRDINAPEGLAFLAGLAPDLLLSAFFNQRLGEAARTLPRAGALNIHPSPLPEFRGVDPVLFARLRGAAHLGVSLHRLTDEFDAGAILARETCPVRPNDSLLKATARLFRKGADLVLANLESITQGFPGEPQPEGGGYDSWPRPAEVRDLRRRGVRLVRWRDLLDLPRGRHRDW